MSFFRSSTPVNTGGNTPVEKEFLPLFTFVGTPDKPNAPIDNIKAKSGTVSNKFSEFSNRGNKSAFAGFSER